MVEGRPFISPHTKRLRDLFLYVCNMYLRARMQANVLAKICPPARFSGTTILESLSFESIEVDFLIFVRVKLIKLF